MTVLSGMGRMWEYTCICFSERQKDTIPVILENSRLSIQLRIMRKQQNQKWLEFKRAYWPGYLGSLPGYGNAVIAVVI